MAPNTRVQRTRVTKGKIPLKKTPIVLVRNSMNYAGNKSPSSATYTHLSCRVFEQPGIDVRVVVRCSTDAHMIKMVIIIKGWL